MSKTMSKTFYTLKPHLHKEALIGMSIGDFLKEAHASLPENKILIQNETRFAFAFAVSDANDNFLFFDRDFTKVKMNDKSIPLENLLYLNHIDLPIASRSVFPDSAFKTPSIQSCIIKDVHYVGEAFEKGGEEEGVTEVVMPIYHIVVDELPQNDESLMILKREQLSDLKLQQITTKTIKLIESVI